MEKISTDLDTEKDFTHSYLIQEKIKKTVLTQSIFTFLDRRPLLADFINYSMWVRLIY